MASKGEVGIELDVARVPLREEGMEPFEIMVSESQGRMLCVVEPAKLDAVLAVCRKWEVRATDIGEVTDSRRFRVLDGGELVGDLPVEVLVDDCPTYALAILEERRSLLHAECVRIGRDPATLRTTEEAVLALVVTCSRAQPRRRSCGP